MSRHEISPVKFDANMSDFKLLKARGEPFTAYRKKKQPYEDFRIELPSGD